MEVGRSDRAFEDLQVVDLADGIAGAFCAKLFASLGARVIKVEPPAGDPLRQRGPFPGDRPDENASGMFLHLNGGKLGMSLDITTDTGAALLRRLLAKTDVLIESFPPGQMADWGLGYDDLSQSLPNLVYTSITPFGQSGPYRAYKADDIAIQALCSYAYTTGDPDREPLSTPGDLAEYFAGVNAWVATLAALAQRSIDGNGDHVDVSMFESLAMADDYNFSCYAATGAIRRRYYSHVLTLYPNDILPCRDGYVSFIPGAAGFPHAVATLVERPELADHLLFNSMLDRVLHWQEFDALVAPWLREHDAAEIVERAQELRMPFAVVASCGDLLQDEHLSARGYFAMPGGPEMNGLRLPGAPMRLTETPVISGVAPRLNEHGGAILVDELGVHPRDMTTLRRHGIA